MTSYPLTTSDNSYSSCSIPPICSKCDKCFPIYQIDRTAHQLTVYFIDGFVFCMRCYSDYRNVSIDTTYTQNTSIKLRVHPVLTRIPPPRSDRKKTVGEGLIGVEPHPGPRDCDVCGVTSEILLYNSSRDQFMCEECHEDQLELTKHALQCKVDCKSNINNPISFKEVGRIKTHDEKEVSTINRSIANNLIDIEDTCSTKTNFYPLGYINAKLNSNKKKAGVDLIGIEPNPGPKSAPQKLKKAVKKVIKDVKRVKKNPQAQAGFKMSGQGDYGPPKKKKGGAGSNYIRKATLGEGLASAGNSLGDWLSGKFQKWFGSGDYSSEVPIHMGPATAGYPIENNSFLAGTSPPVIQNKGQAFMFRHREYVGDIAPTVNFTNTSFLINPGNPLLFPWLNGLADAFEEYQIIGMMVEYKPLISANSVNAQGAVVFSTEYNANKPNFTTKIQMENYEYATSCAPHHSMFHAIECKPDETLFKHRNVLTGSGAVPSNQDARIYHWGNFQLATQGQSNTTGILGELWLSYEIACFKPLFSLNSIVSDFPAVDRYNFNSAIANAGLTAMLLAPDGPSTFPGSWTAVIGNLKASFDGGVLNMPSNITTGRFMFMLQWAPTAVWSIASGAGTIATINAQITPSYINAAPANIMSTTAAYNAFNRQPGVIFHGSTTPAVYFLYFDVTAPGSNVASINFGTGFISSSAVTNSYRLTYSLSQVA